MKYNQDLIIESLLSAMFVLQEIHQDHKIEAQALADQMGENAPDWLLLIAGANLEDPEAVAKEAAKWFVVWWLEENDPGLLKEVNHEK